MNSLYNNFLTGTNYPEFRPLIKGDLLSDFFENIGSNFKQFKNQAIFFLNEFDAIDKLQLLSEEIKLFQIEYKKQLILRKITLLSLNEIEAAENMIDQEIDQLQKKIFSEEDFTYNQEELQFELEIETPLMSNLSSGSLYNMATPNLYDSSPNTDCCYSPLNIEPKENESETPALWKMIKKNYTSNENHFIPLKDHSDSEWSE